MLEIPRKAAWNACHRRLGGRPGGLGGLGPGGLGPRGPGGAWGHGRGARGPGGHGRGHAGPGGAPGAPPIATTPSPAGGIAPLEPRHAVKQLLMLQNPPPARAEGATRTEQPSHDAWERLQRPRPRQLNHHERSLDSAAPPAAPTSDVPTRRVTGPQRSWLSGYRPRATTHPDRTPTSG